MSHPIKILFTIPNFVTAGSGREMLNIIERLDRDKYEPFVCVLKKGGNLYSEIESMGIPIFEAPFVVDIRPYKNFLLRTLQAAKFFKNKGFEIWQSFHWSSNYTEPMIAKFAGVKSFVYTKKSMSWSRAWLLKSLFSKKIVARNTTMEKIFFKSFFLNSKVRLIQGGVDVDKFSPNKKKHLMIREKKQVPESFLLIVCVAQLIPVKGQDILIRALKGCDDVYLLLAGKALDLEYKSELLRLIDELSLKDRVSILDHVADVPALLAEADISVLPTSKKGGHEEGCPVALLEAMACARCCIASNVAGSNDLIQHGVTGYLFEADSITSLQSAIVSLSKNSSLRKRLASEARKSVEQNFTLKKEAEEFQSFYDSLL